jgi:hypothetical protein|nr:hypothetical protein [Kofleriaceae bacterium]
MRALVVIAVAACSSSSPPSPSRSPSPSLSLSPSPSPPPPPARWLPGDLHVHCAPPDVDGEVDGTLDDIAASAAAAKLAFVVVTPHLRPSTWADDPHGKAAAWRDLQARARARATRSDVTLIVGLEWTTRAGHFSVWGSDVAAAIDSRDVVATARAAGAIVTVNHPFALPTHIPGVAASDFDMSYRVWTDHARGPITDIAGAEVWNVPLSLANVISQPGGATGEQLAWRALDARVHATHRPQIAVGGSDDHHGHALATTWVLAADRRESSIVAAVRAGATCVGGFEGGTLRARADGGSDAGIGGAVTGRTVTLTWAGGVAHVFVDGVDRGEHASPFTDDTGGALRTYRLELGSSRCGFIYANL